MTITKNILLKIKKFVDGDGLFVEDFITKKEFEIRLKGIDAPEMNFCNKIKKNEKELQMPAAILIKLGFLSFNFLKEQINMGDFCTLVQEENNLVDKYGRLLGYLILNDGRVLNEIMTKEGYAKPYNEVFCAMLNISRMEFKGQNQHKRIVFHSIQVLNTITRQIDFTVQ